MGFIKNFINLVYSAAVTAIFSYAFYNDTNLFNTGKYRVMGFPVSKYLEKLKICFLIILFYFSLMIALVDVLNF